jgi:hypothetical protein
MTHHALPEKTLEDQHTLRRPAVVIACFIAATATLAVVIGSVLG